MILLIMYYIIYTTMYYIIYIYYIHILYIIICTNMYYNNIYRKVVLNYCIKYSINEILSSFYHVTLINILNYCVCIKF